MSEPDKPEPEGFDWEAPDAFERWAEDHGADETTVSKIRSLPLEERVLQFHTHYLNFEADRYLAWFLKAVAGMKAMREQRDAAIAMIPDAEARGRLMQRQATEDAKALRLFESAKNLASGPAAAGEASSKAKEDKHKIVKAAIANLETKEMCINWSSKKIAETLVLKWNEYSDDVIPYPALAGMYRAVLEIRGED